MFANTMIKEKQSGTFYLLKANGVKEEEIVLSHFVSKLILITFSYLASIALLVPLNLIVFREYTGLRGAVSLSYLYLVLVFALTLSLFISSVVNKKSVGYALAIGAYFVLVIISAFPYINIYIPIHSLTLASNIITDIDYKISDYLINLGMNIIINIGLIIGSILILKKKIDNRKQV